MTDLSKTLKKEERAGRYFGDNGTDWKSVGVGMSVAFSLMTVVAITFIILYLRSIHRL
jgi:hypothetical protein